MLKDIIYISIIISLVFALFFKNNKVEKEEKNNEVFTTDVLPGLGE